MCWSDHGKSVKRECKYNWATTNADMMHTVSTVSVNSLAKTERDPKVHGEDVKVASNVAVEKGATDRTKAKNEDFRWMRVLSSQTEWRRILVMHLVNVLVKGAVVESLVS